MAKRRRMHKLRLKEISGCDVPAQEGALALIMKRDDGAGDPETSKGGIVQLVTGKAAGHRHGVKVRKWNDGDIDIWVLSAQKDGDEYSHDHALLQGADGSYSVVENAGHTHTLDASAMAGAIMGAVQKEDQDMTPEEKAKLEKLEKANERQGKIIALKAEHRAYFDELSTDELKDKWLAKSDTERDNAIAEAAKRAEEEEARKRAADPVVYTTKDGIEIRKSDGPGTLALAKAHDAKADELKEAKGTIAKMEAERTDSTFEKRAAEELPHLPGSLKARAALLKSAESIEDEAERTEAVAALKAQNDRLGPIFKARGVSGTGEVIDITGGGADDPQTKLDELAKKHQEAHPGMTIEAANAAVLETPEGSALYSQIEKRDRAAAKAA